MKLPRSRRIVRRADFQRVRTSGKSIQGRFLTLGFLPDPSLEEPFRLGIVTTKRLGKAVVRNRVRRLLRGVIHRTGERIARPHWLVLVARAASAEASSAQLEKEWIWMMHRAALVEPQPKAE